jgi:hypothetical protein
MEVAWIGHGVVTLKDAYSSRNQHRPHVGAVVSIGPQVSETLLADELTELGRIPLRIIGDAFAPRRLANAILEGHRAGKEV